MNKLRHLLLRQIQKTTALFQLEAKGKRFVHKRYALAR